MAHVDVAGIFKKLDRELWIVTAAHRDRRAGLVCTSVSQASIVPELPRVRMSLARQHHTAEVVEEAGGFAVHLFGEDQLDWAWRFGLQSGRDVDKFAGLDVQAGVTGSPLLAGALAWLECRVENRMDTGDRTVYLAEVLAGRLLRDARPLTMHRLLELAPRDRLAQLHADLARDAARDAEAILHWRQARSGKPKAAGNAASPPAS